MHIKVSDADVFQMISEVDEDNSGAIGSYDSLLSSFPVPFCRFAHRGFHAFIMQQQQQQNKTATTTKTVKLF